MNATKTNEKIFDEKTLMAKRYFSVGGRSRHSPDIRHDKAGLLETSAFEKPHCKAYQKPESEETVAVETSLLKQITKLYLPAMPNSSAPAKADPHHHHNSSSHADLNQTRTRRRAGTQERKASKPPKTKDDEDEDVRSKRIKQRLERLRDETARKRAQDRATEHRNGILSMSPTKPKTYSGPEMIERTKQLMQELKSPEELIDSISQSKQGEYVAGRSEAQEKEKLRKLAKRLDVVLKFEEPNEERKMMSFLKEIPVKYYQLAREQKELEDKLKEAEKLEKARRASRASRARRSQLDDGNQKSSEFNIEDMHRANRSSTGRGSPLKIQLLARSSTQRTEESLIQDSSPIERHLRGSEVTRREKNLFFSPLHKRIKDDSFMKFPTDASPSTGIMSQMSILKETSPIRRKEVESSIWLNKVGEIRQSVQECLEMDPKQLSTINNYQGEILNDLKKLNLEKLEEDPIEMMSEQDYAEGEQQEVIDEVKHRDGKAFNLLKQVLGVGTGGQLSKSGVKENNDFYRRMMLKEKRKVEKILSRPKGGVMSGTTKQSGRDIFNRSAL